MLSFKLLEYFELDITASGERQYIRNRIDRDRIVPCGSVLNVKAELVEQALKPEKRANTFVQWLFVCKVVGHGRLVD